MTGAVVRVSWYPFVDGGTPRLVWLGRIQSWERPPVQSHGGVRRVMAPSPIFRKAIIPSGQVGEGVAKCLT